MATFYRYTQPSELVVDLQSTTTLVYEKGIVDAIMVSNKPNSGDGFIFIYTKAWNSPYKNALRFSYTLAEFQKITFSKEALGLAYYITQNEVNNTVYSWNLLTNAEKTIYLTAAASFILKGFVPFWRSEWNIPETPSSRIKIKKGTTTLTSGVAVSLAATVGVPLTSVFEIENTGASVLELGGITTIGAGSVSIVQPTDLSLLPGESISFGTTATFATTGTATFTIRVASNDNTLPVFSIPVSVSVD